MTETGFLSLPVSTRSLYANLFFIILQFFFFKSNNKRLHPKNSDISYYCKIMGNHPSIALGFSCASTPQEIVQKLSKVPDKDARYTVLGRTAGTASTATIELLFTTPGCGWIDRVKITIDAVDESRSEICV
jgi:hypothetical protein